jgi:hypothetical protein
VLLTILPLWETNIYWNCDTVGKTKGENSVVLPNTVALAVIGQSANSVAVYSWPS